MSSITLSVDNSALVAAALEETNPKLAGLINAKNTWKENLEKHAARIKLFRDYEQGNHRANITEQMAKMLRLETGTSSGLDEFNDNYMQLVVDKMASRIKVAGITINSSEDEEATEWLDKIIARNRFKAIMATAFRGAVRDGDSYVMVDPISLNWSSEPAFDGTHGMVSILNPLTNEMIWACKVWIQADEKGDETAILLVYQKNKVSYFQGASGSDAVEPYNIVKTRLPGDAGAEMEGGTSHTNVKTWPGKKIPIVKFINKANNYKMSGDSELRPVITLQDVLNRLLHSMVMASEMSAFTTKYAIGMKLDVDTLTPGSIVNFIIKDSKGNPVNEITEKQANFLRAIKIGQFQGSDISQYTNQIEAIVKEISQTSSTPIYGITATGNLSGEALRQLEVGLVGKIKRFQNQNDDVIMQLIRITAEVQQSFLQDKVRSELPSAPKVENIFVAWESPEILDVNLSIESLVKMRADAPGLWKEEFYHQKIGALLGMSSKEVKEFAGEGPPEESEDSDGLPGEREVLDGDKASPPSDRGRDRA